MLIRESGVMYIYIYICVCVCVCTISLCVSIVNIAGDFFF